MSKCAQALNLATRFAPDFLLDVQVDRVIRAAIARIGWRERRANARERAIVNVRETVSLIENAGFISREAKVCGAIVRIYWKRDALSPEEAGAIFRRRNQAPEAEE